MENPDEVDNGENKIYKPIELSDEETVDRQAIDRVQKSFFADILRENPELSSHSSTILDSRQSRKKKRSKRRKEKKAPALSEAEKVGKPLPATTKKLNFSKLPSLSSALQQSGESKEDVKPQPEVIGNKITFKPLIPMKLNTDTKVK